MLLLALIPVAVPADMSWQCPEEGTSPRELEPWLGASGRVAGWVYALAASFYDEDCVACGEDTGLPSGDVFEWCAATECVTAEGAILTYRYVNSADGDEWSVGGTREYSSYTVVPPPDAGYGWTELSTYSSSGTSSYPYKEEYGTDVEQSASWAGDIGSSWPADGAISGLTSTGRAEYADYSTGEWTDPTCSWSWQIDNYNGYASVSAGGSYGSVQFAIVCDEGGLWMEGYGKVMSLTDWTLVGTDADGDAWNTAYDCDDADPTVYPCAPETACDGRDHDCDGFIECDADGDGHTPIDESGDDCDDADPTVFLGASEVRCDGIDQDCNGYDQCDADGDRYYAGTTYRPDCDDTDPTVHPEADEVLCDGVDQDCDGSDKCDMDGDGYYVDGYYADCDDTDPTVSPRGTEVECDTIDQDCDGGDLCDADGDGSYARPSGDDCDDTDATVHPGAPEIECDGIAQDCRGYDSCPPADEDSAASPPEPHDPPLADPRGCGGSAAMGVLLLSGWRRRTRRIMTSA
ncbi:MAG: putative metal-binding motif-containing protein [Myxococcota bacterium]